MDGDVIQWPDDIHDNAYTFVYEHSNLKIKKAKPTLQGSVLYEAWAFDGNKSWHIWKQDGTWVCSIYDTKQDTIEDGMRRKQLLSRPFAKMIGKECLVIYERLAYDEDNQAYVAYSCPIDVE